MMVPVFKPAMTNAFVLWTLCVKICLLYDLAECLEKCCAWPQTRGPRECPRVQECPVVLKWLELWLQAVLFYSYCKHYLAWILVACVPRNPLIYSPRFDSVRQGYWRLFQYIGPITANSYLLPLLFPLNLWQSVMVNANGSRQNCIWHFSMRSMIILFNNTKEIHVNNTITLAQTQQHRI